MGNEKNSRAETNRQTGTAQEPKERPLEGQKHSSIPVRADTASWWVDKLKKDYPKDYKAMAMKAIELSKAGVRLSIASLFEWARLELFAGRKGKDCFKLNNNLRAAFSRSLMADYPELEGKFETRKSLSDLEGANSEG